MKEMKQSIRDKKIADCVEALIGAYFEQTKDINVTTEFIKWVGIPMDELGKLKIFVLYEY